MHEAIIAKCKNLIMLFYFFSLVKLAPIEWSVDCVLAEVKHCLLGELFLHISVYQKNLNIYCTISVNVAQTDGACLHCHPYM